MTWRGALADWKDLDQRRPAAWWLGLTGTLAGAVATAVLELRRMAPRGAARGLLVAALVIAVVVVGRRMFWSDAERRLRMPWRILGFAVLVAVLERTLRFAGVHLQHDPNGGTASMLRLTAVAAAMFATAAILAVRLLDRRPLRELGIVPAPGFWGELGFGLALGAVLMTAIFAAEYAAGWVRIAAVAYTRTSAAEAFGGGFVRMAGVFACVAFYEELVSRGYLLRALAQGFVGRRIRGPAALSLGVLVSSLLFAMGHRDNPNASVVSTVNILIAGIVLALPYVLTGRLAASIGFHATWNFFQSTVYGFPTSGFVASVSALHIEQGGPPAWTGGLFGPEAGIVGLVALAVATTTMLWRHRRREGSISFCAALVERPDALTAATTGSPSTSPGLPVS